MCYLLTVWLYVCSAAGFTAVRALQVAVSVARTTFGQAQVLLSHARLSGWMALS